MKSGVPWRLKGIRSDARETAREAARRAGMSVGEWLNTVIIDSADEEGIRLSRRGYDDDEDDSDRLFGVNERLDELTRHIERLHRAPAPRTPYAPAASGPEAYAPPHYTQNRENNQLADAVAQLTRRMDELVTVTHAAATAQPQHMAPPAYASAPAPTPAPAPVYAAPLPVYAQAPVYGAAPTYVPAAAAYVPEARVAAPAETWAPDLEAAMAEIAARQQALDAEPDASDYFAPQRPAAPPPDPRQWQPEPEPPLRQPQYQPQPQYQQPLQQPAPMPPVHQYPPQQEMPAAPSYRHMPPPSLETAPPAPMPSQNLAGLEQHLRHITSQIETLRQQPQLEEGIAALRQTLSEIARTLLDAMPRRAIEALEGEVRALAARLDNTRHSAVDTETLATVERGLAEVRDTLRTLRPAENLDGFREAVHNLAQKVDMLGATGPDANAFHQLEAAISALRGIVSNVASNEALEQLASEVHALGQKIEYVAASAASAGGGVDHSNALEILDQRVAHIADALESRVQNGGSVPPQLEAVIQGLTDKIERLQHSRSDEATSHLEDRVAQLVEKLDATGARFSQLEAIERGLADLLMHIEQRAAGAQSAAPQMDGLQRDMMRTQTSLEAVHGTLGHVVDRLAMLESDMREAQPQPQPQQFQPQPQPHFEHEDRRQQHFEPEHQQQPRFEPEPQPPMPPAAQLSMPAPAAERPVFAEAPPPAEISPPPSREIAHAQAAAAMARANPKPVRAPIDPNLPPDEPLEPGMGAGRGRFAASPADRIAASEAALGHARPRDADADSKSNFIAAARRAARAANADPTTADLRAVALQSEVEEKAGKSLTQRVRQLFVGASVILIAGGALRVATNLMDTGDTPPNTEVASSSAPGTVEATPPVRTPSIIATAPSTPALELPPSNDVTGSIFSPVPTSRSYSLPPSLALPGAPSMPAPQTEKLPPVIGGSSLRAAAAAGDPAAEYELGIRYAEGHGVAANATEAARWLELAAKQGLAMAQFRLAGLYEKGMGVKKDIETARRLYKSAAEQGNAKAMHNLAVLYAEGAAVKPDYRTAAQWFRQAADYGVADSQYNLAILYARGIGVDQNLVESYKWFALAADQGDADSARKRDEVAKRLDPAALSTAKLAVKSFQPQPQPEAANTVKPPAGGWDAASSAEPAPAKPKRNNVPVRAGAR